MGKLIQGHCVICGRFGKLSREHCAPKGAFNSGQFKSISINRHKTRGRIVTAEKWRDGGNTRFTTCQKCNNTTGGWYAKDYIDFAQACASPSISEPAGKICRIPTIPFYPLRVVKQVVCSLLALAHAPEDTDPTDLTPVCAPRRKRIGGPATRLSHGCIRRPRRRTSVARICTGQER